MKHKAIPILIFLFLSTLLASVHAQPVSAGKDVPKIAVWDLTSGNINPSYAQDLTNILVSEISKLGKYEVYSQENVRTLAGWTAERMQLGCTDTKCLTALGQMDIAKLISGRVGKIGNTYSISLNLFNTEKVRSENSISVFCNTENEMIVLAQQAVRKLLGEGSRILEDSGTIPKEVESFKGKWKSSDQEFFMTIEKAVPTNILENDMEVFTSAVYVDYGPKAKSYGNVGYKTKGKIKFNKESKTVLELAHRWVSDTTWKGGTGGMETERFIQLELDKDGKRGTARYQRYPRIPIMKNTFRMEKIEE
jgi:hypothetical protein